MLAHNLVCESIRLANQLIAEERAKFWYNSSSFAQNGKIRVQEEDMEYARIPLCFYLFDVSPRSANKDRVSMLDERLRGGTHDGESL